MTIQSRPPTDKDTPVVVLIRRAMMTVAELGRASSDPYTQDATAYALECLGLAQDKLLKG